MKKPKTLFMQHPMDKLLAIREQWRILKDRATSKVLDNEHLNQVRILKAKYETINFRVKPNEKLDMKMIRQRIDLMHQIVDIFKEFGYPSEDSIIYREGDKVGLLDLLGNKLTSASYDEFCFTYDDDSFISCYKFVVRKGGKWGVVNAKEELVIPFEYDFIARVPSDCHDFLVVRDGKEGIINDKGEVLVTCEMDSIHTPGYKSEPYFFQKDEKWGWYWSYDSDFYQNEQKPYYDEIFYMSESEWKKLDDEDEEFFEARINDEVHYILEWSAK